VPVRGNVGTRVAKAEGPGLDGVVLAAAGLHRLGLHARITQYLDPEVCIPEAGQGALAIETRAGDRTAQEIAQAADHGETRAAVTAEVTVVRALGGGCTVPIAAFAQVGDGVIRLRAMVADADGRRVVRAEATGPAGDPEAVGRAAAQRLRALGAGELLSGGSPQKGAP
jgi:hydroxymethylbilane synthase